MLTKTTVLLFFLGLFINSTDAQNCIFACASKDDPNEDFKFFCFDNPNLQSGATVQMTCSEFLNLNSGQNLIISYDDFADPIANGYDICDENGTIIIERQFNLSNDNNAKSTGCSFELVFVGENFQDPNSCCNDQLTLNIVVSDDITPSFTVPADVSVPLSYDIFADPENRIGQPTNATQGTFSQAFIPFSIINEDGTEELFAQITWTLQSCCSSVSHTQVISYLPDCTHLSDAMIDNAPIDATTYAGNTKITSAGTVATNTNVRFFAEQQIELKAGFTVEAGATFTAAIQECTDIPTNDNCENALFLNCGQLVVGQTTTATTPSNIVDNCLDEDGQFLDEELGKGVFYRFFGDGSYVLISTNFSVTDFDTELRIYSGDCDNNFCLIGNDDSPNAANNESEVYFLTELGTEYLVFVDGYLNNEGTFGLQMDCFESINCGTDLTSTTEGEMDNYGASDYSSKGCNAFSSYEGADRAYYLEVIDPATYTFNLTELNADLDLLVYAVNDYLTLETCIGNSLLGGTSDESFTTTLNPGKYLVIIDAFGLASSAPTSSFRLDATCVALQSEEVVERSQQEETMENDFLINKKIYVRIAPNPLTDITTLKYYLTSENSVQVTILDVNGQQIQQLPAQQKSVGTHTQQLDLSQQTSGIYMVEIRIGKERLYQRIVLQ